MLISFDASAAELSSHPEPEIEELFSELVRSSRRGYHFVLIDRVSSDWALQNLTLGSREKAHLEALRSAYTQRGQLLRQANVQLRIGLGTFGLQKQANLFTIGHVPLLRGDYLERSILLVENGEGDGEFIKSLFSIVRRDHPVKTYDFDVRHGGGSTIVKVFDDLIKSKKIVVCLVDSDKVSPISSRSATVKSLAHNAELQTFPGQLFVTLCREIENHLPFDLIWQHGICPQYPDFQKLADLINNQNTVIPSERLWLSFDVKKGFIGATIGTQKYKEKERNWLELHLCQGQSPQTWSIAGFGDAVLLEFMKSGPAMRDFASFVHSDTWRSYFGNFFEDMLWYFAAEKKVSTR